MWRTSFSRSAVVIPSQQPGLPFRVLRYQDICSVALPRTLPFPGMFLLLVFSHQRRLAPQVASMFNDQQSAHPTARSSRRAKAVACNAATQAPRPRLLGLPALVDRKHEETGFGMPVARRPLRGSPYGPSRGDAAFYRHDTRVVVKRSQCQTRPPASQ